jgi:hypothetical protein
MGLRFRTSLGIAPGIRLNLGKKGTSVSVGGRGGRVTLGPNSIRTTVGIPGTGLSYSKSHRYQNDGGGSSRRTSTPAVWIGLALCLAAAFLWLLAS